MLKVMILASLLTFHFAQATEHMSLNYLRTDSIQIKMVLPSPPLNGSPEANDDFLQVLRAQALRTDLDCNRARTEIPRKLTTFFGAPYGPLTFDEVQKVNALIVKVLIDTQYFENQAKSLFARTRPFVDDPLHVHPCSDFELPRNGSYPSGHSLEAHVIASVLELIYPERKQIFELRASQIAGDRLIAGVHYPSDLEAGKIMAAAIFAALESSPTFQAEFSTALLQSMRAK